MNVDYYVVILMAGEYFFTYLSQTSATEHLFVKVERNFWVLLHLVLIYCETCAAEGVRPTYLFCYFYCCI